MYDIHCHVLYGVDDGADTFDESLEMLRLAYEGGSVGVVATPHNNPKAKYNSRWDSDSCEKLRLLREELKKEEIPLEIYTGHEILCTGDFIDKLKSGEVVTLNNSRFPLVEFLFNERSEDVYRKLGLLLAEGYIPVVAHPERYAFIKESPDAAKKLREMGCLLQINKSSLMGKFGATVKSIAVSMISRELACVVASDGHSPYSRTPYLGDVHEYISERWSTAYADTLLCKNPEAIIRDKLPNTGV